MIKNRKEVLTYFAEKISKAVIANSIRQYQKWKITLSGPGSGLITTWDEICVQIQGEYSFHWDDYEEAVENHLQDEIEKLNEFERIALWYQTDPGYYFDEEEDEVPVYIEGDILEYLKAEIFKKAGSWSNERIRKYLE